jgi:REP element-mobilizing transposase RayT
MRPLRVLKQGVWYEIRSQVNNRKPLFRRSKALALFDQVFREAQLRFVFTVRSLRLEDDWLTFYIKPENGMELPVIMKWMKQTFAQRYNRLMGWIGHLWGDRYWSWILKGEPPGESSPGGSPQAWGGGEETAPAAGTPTTGVRPPIAEVRPQGGNETENPDFPPISPRPAAISPG